LTGYEAWTGRSRFSLSQPSPRVRLDVVNYLSQLPDAATGRRHGDSLFRADWGWVKMSLRPYLTAIADLGINPGRILDLGCGDGLATCFYAVHFPNAEVFALDGCKLCLSTTRAIASRLGLRNVRIVEGEISQLGSLFDGAHFDAIVARSLVLHRLLHAQRDRQDDDSQFPVSTIADVARASRMLLRPNGGVLISTERWDRAADLRYWASTVADAGFLVDWSASRSIPPQRASSRWRYFMLVARAIDGRIPIAPHQLLAFLANEESSTGVSRPALVGYTAEALFKSLDNRGLIWGFEARRGGFVLRRTFHEVGALLALYDSTNWHERELSFWPRRASGELREQLNREAGRLESQGWTIWYLAESPCPPEDRQAQTAR
jgi:SAM-dependent methyltransferase